MKDYGLIPSMPTYTALFNACGNSPWKEDGLTRATRLRATMEEKGLQLNAITMKAMVKAYGRHGDMQTAFAIIDELVSSGLQLDAEGWSHLLMACISDREAGFKHSIEVWRLMRKKRLVPNIFQYNLLLRAARDCGVGDAHFANQLLTGKSTAASLPPGGSSSQPAEQPSHTGMIAVNPASVEDVNNSTDQSQGSDHTSWWERSEKTSIEMTVSASERHSDVSVLDQEVPNMLNPRGRWRHQVVSLGDLSTPASRLALLGGLPGILRHMKADKVEPNIKTFTQMLDMVPPTREGEADLVHAMSAHGVKPDIDFLNLVIRRRCKHRDLEGAKAVLDLMGQLRIQPNFLSFACLATGCYGHKAGLQLLRDIQTADLRPTVDIYGILVRRSHMDFAYKRALCASMKTEGVDPDQSLLETLEAHISKARTAIVRREQGKTVDPVFMNSRLGEDFKKFMIFYKGWLLESGIDLPQHPWAQYRRPSAGDPVEDMQSRTSQESQ